MMGNILPHSVHRSAIDWHGTRGVVGARINRALLLSLPSTRMLVAIGKVPRPAQDYCYIQPITVIGRLAPAIIPHAEMIERVGDRSGRGKGPQAKFGRTKERNSRRDIGYSRSSAIALFFGGLSTAHPPGEGLETVS